MNIEQKNSIEERIKEYRLWIFQLNQKYGVGNFINVEKFNKKEYHINRNGIISILSPKQYEEQILIPLIKFGFLIPNSTGKKGFKVITNSKDHELNILSMIKNMQETKAGLEAALKELEINFNNLIEIKNFYEQHKNS